LLRGVAVAVKGSTAGTTGGAIFCEIGSVAMAFGGALRLYIAGVSGSGLHAEACDAALEDAAVAGGCAR
jgi:predicted outer membrane repeat protein